MSLPPDEGHQAEEARVLDRLREFALVLAAERGPLARLDLAVRHQELGQVRQVLVVERLGRQLLGALLAETAELAAAALEAAAAAVATTAIAAAATVAATTAAVAAAATTTVAAHLSSSVVFISLPSAAAPLVSATLAGCSSACVEDATGLSSTGIALTSKSASGSYADAGTSVQPSTRLRSTLSLNCRSRRMPATCCVSALK